MSGFMLPAPSRMAHDARPNLPFQVAQGPTRSGALPNLPFKVSSGWDRASYGGGIGWPAFNSIPYHLPVVSSRAKNTDHDLGTANLCFVYTDERLNKAGREYRYKTLSALNAFLKHDPDARIKYGDPEDSAALIKDWRLYGVQQTTLAEWQQGNRDKVLTFWVGMRARVPNIWLCDETVRVDQQTSLYLMLKRFEYQSPGRALGAAAPAVPAAGHHFRQFVPVATKAGGISPNRYIRVDDIGACLPVGIVTAMHGNLNNDDGYRNIARQACYPDTIDMDYKKCLLELPELDVQFRTQ